MYLRNLFTPILFILAHLAAHSQDITYTVTPITSFNNGSIDLQINTGDAPFEFNWEGPGGITFIEEDLIDLTVLGTYCVTVTDANCCKAIGCLGLHSCNGIPIPVDISEFHANTTSSISNDGSIDITIDGSSSGNYSYQWVRLQDSEIISTEEDLDNLSVGTYCVTVTDACDQTATQCIEIVSCDMNITISRTPTCNGVPDGALQAYATGSAPFEYQWSNGETTNYITNLYPGTYSVTITDGILCSIVKEINLKAVGPTYDLDVSIIGSCDNQLGTIDLTLQGGDAPFTYKWSNGATTQDLQGLEPNDYCVTITDSNGCKDENCYNVPFIGVELEAEVGHSCSGGPEGTIELDIIGGSGNYGYQWSDGNTDQWYNWYLYPGEYCVTITDLENQCEASSCYTIEIQPIEGYIQDGTITNVCSGDESLGSIDIVVPVDQPGSNVSYAWSNGATTQDINNLEAGIYCVTVSVWPSECFEVECYQVEEIDSEPISISAELIRPCNGESNGSIDLTVDSDALPITFEWNNGEETEDLTNLSSALYCVTVSNSSSCTITECFTLSEYNSLVLLSATSTCENIDVGEVTVSANTLYPPISFVWENGSNGSSISNLPVGNYCVTATDARGCTRVMCEEIDLTLDVETSVQQACYGLEQETYGSIQLMVSGGESPYEYTWSNGATSSTISGLESGSFNVTITDDNDCEAYRSFSIVNEILQATVYIDDEILPDVSGCFGLEGCIDGLESLQTDFYPVTYAPDDVIDPCQGGLICCPASPSENCLYVSDGSTFYEEELEEATEYGDGYCWYYIRCIWDNVDDIPGVANVNGEVYHYAYGVALCGAYGLTGEGSSLSTQLDNFQPSKDSNRFSISISPNPIYEEITLNFSSVTEQKVNVEVFTVLGEKIFEEKHTFEEGNFAKSLYLDNWLAEGVYFIKVSNEFNYFAIKKLIKKNR